jgi:Restriction endonuclease
MSHSTWLDYQRLVAEIYADLEPIASVTHDDKILGSDSGIERQIDVSIRTSVAGHDILVIVQAKELSRPADVNIVGEFQSVIRDVRAAKGVLICSAGYTSTALEYARKLDIDLCTAHDAQHKKWAVDLKIPLLWVEYEGSAGVAMKLVADRSNSEDITLDTDAASWLTTTDGGATTRTIGELLSDAWNAMVSVRSPDNTYEFQLAKPGTRVRLGTSFWCPAQSLLCTCDVRRRTWLGSFSVSECRGILNRGTNALRARVRLSDKDVPITRDESWPVVDDVEAVWTSSPMLLCVEKRAAPSSFALTHGTDCLRVTHF